MSRIELLLKQTQDAHEWTNKLVDSIPYELWEQTPNQIASNISWQVGHLIISEHYHAILVVLGFQKEIMDEIPMRKYGEMYSYDTSPEAVAGKITPKLLRKQLSFMQAQVIETISNLADSNLDENVLQPIKMKHPVASTKLDAVCWNIKHTMWHCGQIATLKRMLHGGYDFGLPKKE